MGLAGRSLKWWKQGWGWMCFLWSAQCLEKTQSGISCIKQPLFTPFPKKLRRSDNPVPTFLYDTFSWRWEQLPLRTECGLFSRLCPHVPVDIQPTTLMEVPTRTLNFPPWLKYLWITHSASAAFLQYFIIPRLHQGTPSFILPLSNAHILPYGLPWHFSLTKGVLLYYCHSELFTFFCGLSECLEHATVMALRTSIVWLPAQGGSVL